MGPEHCRRPTAEFVQFYHRRMAWLQLQRYDRALKDADHTLALMDLRRPARDQPRVRQLARSGSADASCSTARRPPPPWRWSARRPDEAVDAIREGIDRIGRHRAAWDVQHDQDESPDGQLIEQLGMLEVEIRKNFAVEKTLREQLDRGRRRRGLRARRPAPATRSAPDAPLSGQPRFYSRLGRSFFL